MREIMGSDLRAMRMVSGLTNVGTPSVNQFIAMAAACGLKASEIIMNYEGEDQAA